MKRVKKVICIVLSVISLLGMTTPIYADTVEFDVTAIADPSSKRVIKAGGSKYENKFYVTGLTFNKEGILCCISVNLENQGIMSYDADISSTYPKSSANYRTTAPSGVYYFMSASSNTNLLRVTGRYTP